MTTQRVTKLIDLTCDKIQKIKLGQLKTQIVAKLRDLNSDKIEEKNKTNFNKTQLKLWTLKNSNCDKTKKSNFDNSKTKIVTKLKDLIVDTTQTLIVTIPNSSLNETQKQKLRQY